MGRSRITLRLRLLACLGSIMELRYFATFRDLTHENTRRWMQPETSLRELVETLRSVYGDPFYRAVVQAGELSPIAIILVNGKDAHHTGGLTTPLQADDVVCFFPMVAGG